MSNIYDKASLVLIPSGTKTSKVYSQKPTSGDGDFTFSRSTAATRVNADGNIEKETQNLLTYSNTFDQWSDTTIVLTSGQSGYDGSSDAWLMAKNGSNSRIFLGVTTSGVTTTSVYAKANASNYLRLRLDTTNATSNTFFDLVNGSVDSTGYSIDAKIEAIGNGWYRCSVVPNDPTTIVRLYPAEQTATTDPAGSIYIQDAQLEQGLVARDVITTTTSAVEGGITDNVPRLDYTDASCPSLLLEPQRTNSATHSEYFGAWSAFRATITDNSATSPEGVSNAAVLTEDTTTNSHPLNKTFSVSSGVEYTLTIFAKQGSRRYLTLLALNGGSNIYYDLQEKTAGSGGSVEDYGNGWLRLIYTYTTNSTSAELYIQPSIDGVTQFYTGDGSNAVFLYGAQLEAGSYATSYIPTYGSAVTRNAPSLGKYDFTDSSTQTLFVEYDHTAYGSGGAEFIIEKTNPVGAIFRIYVDVDSSSNDNNKVRFRTEFPVSQFDYNTSRTRSQNQKVAFVISGTTAKAFCNGSLVKTFTITETTMEQLNYRVQNGKFRTKQLLMLPTALTDQEAIDLTTI